MAAPPRTGEASPPGPGASASRRPNIVLGVVGAVFAVLAVAVVLAILNSGPKPKTYTYVVPKGTAAKVKAGRNVEIMPTTVRMKVGDRLVIHNRDSATATVGPYSVRAGETVDQKFSRPQTLVGACSLSGSGEIEIIVT